MKNFELVIFSLILFSCSIHSYSNFQKSNQNYIADKLLGHQARKVSFTTNDEQASDSITFGNCYMLAGGNILNFYGFPQISFENLGTHFSLNLCGEVHGTNRKCANYGSLINEDSCTQLAGVSTFIKSWNFSSKWDINNKLFIRLY